MRYIVSVFLFIACVTISAQTMPLGWHVKAEALTGTSQDYNLKTRDGKPVASGSARENIASGLNVGYAFKLKENLNLQFAGKYNYSSYSMSGLPTDIKWNTYNHNFQASVNAMYTTRAFGKPLVAFVNVNADASQWGVERVSGVGAAILMLKANRTTQFGLGGIVLVNTTSRIPFFVIPTYRHVFSPRWTINLNYPFFAMQYTPDKRNTIGAGFTIDTYKSWQRPGSSALPKTVFCRKSLFKTGLNYDCKLSESLTLMAQAGWEYTMKGGVYTANGRHLIYDLNHQKGLYLHAGVTFRP